MRTADITTKTISAAAMMIGTNRLRFRSISPPPSSQPCVSRQQLPGIHDRRSALDLHDIHRRPRRDHVVLVQRARRPHFAGELDESARTGYLLQNHRLLPDKRVAALAHQWRMG